MKCKNFLDDTDIRGTTAVQENEEKNLVPHKWFEKFLVLEQSKTIKPLYFVQKNASEYKLNINSIHTYIYTSYTSGTSFDLSIPKKKNPWDLRKSKWTVKCVFGFSVALF
jgi:hypothetical protein